MNGLMRVLVKVKGGWWALTSIAVITATAFLIGDWTGSWRQWLGLLVGGAISFAIMFLFEIVEYWQWVLSEQPELPELIKQHADTIEAELEIDGLARYIEREMWRWVQ